MIKGSVRVPQRVRVTSCLAPGGIAGIRPNSAGRSDSVQMGLYSRGGLPVNHIPLSILRTHPRRVLARQRKISSYRIHIPISPSCARTSVKGHTWHIVSIIGYAQHSESSQFSEVP